MSNGFSSTADQLEVAETVLGFSQILPDIDSIKMEDDSEIEDNDDVQTPSGYQEVASKQDSVSSPTEGKDVIVANMEKSVASYDINMEKDLVWQRSIPFLHTGQRIYEIDLLLRSHHEHLDYRYAQYRRMHEAIDKYEGGLEVFSRGYEKFGFNPTVMRDYI